MMPKGTQNTAELVVQSRRSLAVYLSYWDRNPKLPGGMEDLQSLLLSMHSSQEIKTGRPSACSEFCSPERICV